MANPYQPFLIAPLDSGLDKKYNSWLAPEDAVVEGNNFLVRKGRIEKRRGYSIFNDFGNNEAILGILTYIDALNGKELIIIQNGNPNGTFYRYNAGTGNFTAVAGSSISGSDYSFFNQTIFPAPPANRMYFTNGVGPVQYYNGTSITIPTITTNAAGAQVATAQWVFFYGERLVLLSTTEAGNLNGQRARWSAVENPSLWRDDIQGEGGFVDAPTGDFIIGAEFLRDTLIVFFENSIWALRKNPDPLLPFVWTQINDSRECQSPYGVVGYDKFVVGFGKTGIVATDGSGAELIDQKIPLFIQENMRLSQLDQIYGFRYKQEEETWWTYPSSSNPNQDENDSVLILSNEFKAWGKADLALIGLGDFEESEDPAWEDFDGVTYPEYCFNDFTDETFLDPVFTEGNRLILGGTLDGKLFTLDSSGSDNGAAINFEIITKEFNPFYTQGQRAYLGYVDLLLDTDILTQLSIDFRTDSSSTAVLTEITDCLPNNAQIGSITAVSKANPGQVTSPDHGLTTGDQIYIYNVEGMTQLNGVQYTITVVDNNNFTIATDTTSYGTYTSDGVVSTHPLRGDKVWKRVYAGLIGNFHQLRIYHTEANQPVTLHGIVLWAKPVRAGSFL